MAPLSDPNAVLRRLVEAAGSGSDLVRRLSDLLDHAREAVPSCLGVSLTVTRHGLPVTVVALTQQRLGEPVRSSLALRLPAPANSESGNALTIYASTSGAFSSMAPDLIALLDLDSRQAIIDGHLELPMDTDVNDTLHGQLEDASTVDHALGVLLDRGLLPAKGRAELERLAAEHNSSVPAAARLVLDAVRNPQVD